MKEILSMESQQRFWCYRNINSKFGKGQMTLFKRIKVVNPGRKLISHISVKTTGSSVIQSNSLKN